MRRWGTALALTLGMTGGTAAAQGTCEVWEGDAAAHVAVCDAELARAKTDGARAEILRDRGYVHELAGDLDLAEADYREALRLQPGSADALTDLSWLLNAQGEAAEAMALAEEAVALAPTSAYPLTRLAWAQHGVAAYEDCVATADRGLAAEAAYGLHSARGACLAQLGRDAEALADFDAAAAGGEDAGWIARNRAGSLYQLGRTAEAEAAAREALAIDPAQGGPLRVLIQALGDGGRVDEAVAAYDAYLPALGLEAADAEAVRNSLAWRLFEAGQAQRALPYIEGWAADHPDPSAEDWGTVDTLDTLGHVLAAVGEADRAAAAFADAARLGGVSRVAMYRQSLARVGIEAGAGSLGLKAALRECTGLGAACVIYPL